MKTKKEKLPPNCISWLEEQILMFEENELTISHSLKLIQNFTKRIDVVKQQNNIQAKRAFDYIMSHEKEYIIPAKFKRFFQKKLWPR